MYAFQEEVAELMHQQVGVTAELVQEALSRLDPVSSSALIASYRTPGRAASVDQGEFIESEISAASRLGISPDVYRARLRGAHADFMLAFVVARRELFAAA